MYRREVFLRQGGLDVGPGEDLEFSLRLRRLGYAIRFAPEAWAETDGPTTAVSLLRQRARWDRDALRIRIPNERLMDPKVGNEVNVVFGNRRIPGKIAQILPVSGVFTGQQQQQLVARDRPATQIARIRFDADASPPPLNTTVDVRMHYSAFSARVSGVLVWLFGLY